MAPEEQFPRFDALFASHPNGRRCIVDGDTSGFIRRRAELCLELAAERRIDGVDKLAANAGSPEKFVNLVSELRVALVFAKLGARVTMLRDAEFGAGKCYTPDLAVHFDAGLSALVEVTRGSDGAPRFAEHLHDAISGSAVRYRVEYSVGQALSRPDISGRDRESSSELSRCVARAVRDALLQAQDRGIETGLVHIVETDAGLNGQISADMDPSLPIAGDLQLPARSAWIASLSFGPPPVGTGYVAGGVTSAHFYADDDHREKFLRDLKKKAERRTHLPAEHRSKIFIVAFENDEVELSPQTVLGSLTGTRAYRGGNQIERERWVQACQAQYPDAVKVAADTGWERLLGAWSYRAGARVALTDFGAYLEQAEGGWASELSAVLVRHHGGSTLQWLPNPFARAELREPRLIDIGLPIEALGRGSGD